MQVCRSAFGHVFALRVLMQDCAAQCLPGLQCTAVGVALEARARHVPSFLLQLEQYSSLDPKATDWDVQLRGACP